MIWCPPYLKFIFTAEKRDSKKIVFDRTLRMLASNKIYDVNDNKVFETEAKQLLLFAYHFLTQKEEKEKDGEPVLFQDNNMQAEGVD